MGLITENILLEELRLLRRDVRSLGEEVVFIKQLFIKEEAAQEDEIRGHEKLVRRSRTKSGFTRLK